MQVFVGREPERRALRAALDRAVHGAGGWVLVTGEAGLGKTRLVDAVLAGAGAPDVRCVWSAARETEMQVAYRPWLPVLRALETGPGGLLQQVRERGRTGAGDRADLHDEVADLLVRSAAERPLVVVLEDLHWADPDALALLETVAPALRSSPALLVTTSRTPVGPAGRPLRPDLHLPLGPLSPQEVQVLADDLGAPPALAGDLHARTGGNPLFVVELVQTARARGDDGSLPATLAAGVTARLAAAGPAAARVAAAAAVLGQEPRLDQLLQVTGADGDATAAQQDGLARLVGERLLVPAPGAVLRYRFPHALLREAVLAGLARAERAALAARAAAVLRAGGAAPGVVAPLVVDAAAGGALPVGEALAALRDAAAEAEQVCAWEQAGALREQAAALGQGGAQEARLVLEHADALARAGDGRARERHLAAAALARAAGDPDALALAALGLSGGLGGGEVPLRDREQVALLDEALGRLPPGPLRAHVRARRSVALTFLAAEAERAAEAQTALAEAGDDAGAAVVAMSALADARSGPAHVASRLQLGQQMVERAARAGNAEHELLGLRVRLVAELERGDLPAARSTIAAHGALAERLGQARYRWYAPLWRGALALARGDLATARVATEEAAALGERAGSGNAVTLTLSQRVVTHLLTRDVAALQAMVEPALVDYPDVCGPRVAHAWAAVLSGDPAARPALERLVAHDLPALPVDAEWLPTVTFLGDAVARLGAADLAGPLLEALAPWVDLFVVDGIADALFGSTARPVGALTALAGAPARADALFAAALHAEEAAGMPLLAAETREAWGTALVRTGHDVGRGRALLQAAAAWRASAGLAEPRPAPLDDVAVLVRSGDCWEYVRGERRVPLPTSRGLELLAALLARPGEEVRAVDLDGRAVAEDDLGPALDRQAAAAYRARVAALTDELAAASDAGDADRVARVRRERDQLEQALGAALGLGGRPRPQGSSAERARSTVTKALRSAVRRLGDVDPLVGEHLAASVRTGAWCAYRPDPGSRLTWRVSA